MYDPITGKYGLAIISAIRAAGIATVSGLGLAVFLMLRRERRSGLRPDTTQLLSGWKA
jgi:hypothetical protein